MPLNYSPTPWVAGLDHRRNAGTSTAITAARLNHLEQGVKAVSDAVDTGGGGGGGTVFFGSEANTARPMSSSPIMWVGNTGVVPVNAEENDMIFTAAPGTIPDPDPDNNAPTAVLSLSSVGLTATATWSTNDVDGDTVTATNINWGDGTAAVSNPTSGVTHLYGAGGTYTVTLTVSDGTDLGVDVDNVIITAPPAGTPGLYKTNFSSNTAGVAPSDWTINRWNPSGTITATVRNDLAGEVGNHILTTVKAGGTTTGRNFASWDAPVDALTDPDVEVLYKWRSPLNTAFRFMVLASGTSGNETGLYLYYLNDSTMQFTAYIAGSAVALGTMTPGSFTANTWYITRVRVEAGQVKGRSWLASGSEPGTWQGTLTLPTELLVPGRLGVLTLAQNQTSQLDWVSVGVGGLTAEMGP